MKRALALLFFCLAACLAQADLPFPGDHGGNGGDPQAADFVARGHFLLQAMKTRSDMSGILGPVQIERFESALATTRIEFVDRELPGGKIYAATSALIQVYRPDWTASLRLQVDLLRAVFQAYLEVIGSPDRGDVLVDKLKVTDEDFQKQQLQNPACPDGQMESVSLILSLEQNFADLRSAAYINGVDFAPGDRTSYRIYSSQRLCSTKTYSFAVRIGSFSRTLSLRGGERVTLVVPSGVLYRE